MTAQATVEICPLGVGEFRSSRWIGRPAFVTHATKGSPFPDYDWTIHFVRMSTDGTWGTRGFTAPFKEDGMVYCWISPDREARGY